MSSYLGRHAELYDLFYAEKPYEQEAAFVDQQLRVHGVAPDARVLEIACGTGRHALALEALGYSLTAVDYSTDMIRRARARANERHSRVDFRCADMRDLQLRIAPCDAAICLFDSIGYVQTNEALDTALQNIRRHVRPDGVLVFEFWHAAAMLRGFDPLRVRRWQTPTGELLRISETSLDCARQLSHVRYTVYELGADGQYTQFQETQSNRYFLLREMESFLSRAGWSSQRWFAGFTDNEKIDEHTWHVVAVARNAAVAQQAAA